MTDYLHPAPPWTPNDAEAFNARYRAVVHPCLLDGEPTIFCERGLEERDPAAFERHVEFAAANGLRLHEERRTVRQPIAAERRRTGLSMLALGVTLLGVVGVTTAADLSTPESQSALSPRAPAHASPRDDVVVRDLLTWLRAQDIAIDPLWTAPVVKRISQNEILTLAFGEELPQSISRDQLKVFGLYDFKDETIYLSDEIDLATDRGRSILVHELAHYLQYRDGANNRVRCKNELETLAYELEARYLQEHRHAPDVTAAQVRLMSSCT